VPASFSAGLMTAAAATTLLLLLLPLVQVTQAFVLAPQGGDRRLIGGERKRIEDCRRRPPSFLGAGEGLGALGSALADRQQASSSSSNSNSSKYPSSSSSSSSTAPLKSFLPPILPSSSSSPAVVVLNQHGEDAAAEARFVAECEMPTDRGNFRMRSYRCKGIYAALEPVALTYGSLAGKENVLARIHDQCLTSEVFGSKRCDCKEQLGMALDMVKEQGGVVIYLQQEGRGIGLANKVAAYALQDEGLDTVDANRHLGFGDDERTYDIVPSILRDLKVKSIQLMTNNPLKLQCLQTLGISVTKVVPIVVAPNAFNERYVLPSLPPSLPSFFPVSLCMLVSGALTNFLSPSLPPSLPPSLLQVSDHQSRAHGPHPLSRPRPLPLRRRPSFHPFLPPFLLRRRVADP